MIELVKPFAEWCSAVIEVLGVGLIVAFALYAIGVAVLRLFKGRRGEALYKESRQRLGQGILVGLEFLVAADIVHTVAVDLRFETVGVLFLIVLIRTFLSFTLEVELTGNWPWQNEE
jgi:uncharacterized membrane protein